MPERQSPGFARGERILIDNPSRHPDVMQRGISDGEEGTVHGVSERASVAGETIYYVLTDSGHLGEFSEYELVKTAIDFHAYPDIDVRIHEDRIFVIDGHGEVALEDGDRSHYDVAQDMYPMEDDLLGWVRGVYDVKGEMWVMSLPPQEILENAMGIDPFELDEELVEMYEADHGSISDPAREALIQLINDFQPARVLMAFENVPEFDGEFEVAIEHLRGSAGKTAASGEPTAGVMNKFVWTDSGSYFWDATSSNMTIHGGHPEHEHINVAVDIFGVDRDGDDEELRGFVFGYWNDSDILDWQTEVGEIFCIDGESGQEISVSREIESLIRGSSPEHELSINTVGRDDDALSGASFEPGDTITIRSDSSSPRAGSEATVEFHSPDEGLFYLRFPDRPRVIVRVPEFMVEGHSKTAAGEDLSQMTPEEYQAYLDQYAGTNLEGLPGPVNVPEMGRLQFQSNRDLQDLAGGYYDAYGQDYSLSDHPYDYLKVNPETASQIATEYEGLEHNPYDPQVQESYRAFIDETVQQYADLVNAGYVFEFYPLTHDPYPNSPRQAVMDLYQNGHMYVYPTDDGFGSSGEDEYADHPLLEMVPNLTWNQIQEDGSVEAKSVTANDLFRAVHDVYGHAKEGVGFRADGEDNAYRQHSAMYSPLARGAMAAETRGQNSWVNYGPYGESNQTAGVEDTIFAPQKATILPEWAQDPNIHRGYVQANVDLNGLWKTSATEPYVEPEPDENGYVRMPTREQLDLMQDDVPPTPHAPKPVTDVGVGDLVYEKRDGVYGDWGHVVQLDMKNDRALVALESSEGRHGTRWLPVRDLNIAANNPGTPADLKDEEIRENLREYHYTRLDPLGRELPKGLSWFDPDYEDSYDYKKRVREYEQSLEKDSFYKGAEGEFLYDVGSVVSDRNGVVYEVLDQRVNPATHQIVYRVYSYAEAQELYFFEDHFVRQLEDEEIEDAIYDAMPDMDPPEEGDGPFTMPDSDRFVVMPDGRYATSNEELHSEMTAFRFGVVTSTFIEASDPPHVRGLIEGNALYIYSFAPLTPDQKASMLDIEAGGFMEPYSRVNVALFDEEIEADFSVSQYRQFLQTELVTAGVSPWRSVSPEEMEISGIYGFDSNYFSRMGN